MSGWPLWRSVWSVPRFTCSTTSGMSTRSPALHPEAVRPIASGELGVRRQAYWPPSPERWALRSVPPRSPWASRSPCTCCCRCCIRRFSSTCPWWTCRSWPAALLLRAIEVAGRDIALTQWFSLVASFGSFFMVAGALFETKALGVLMRRKPGGRHRHLESTRFVGCLLP